MTITRGSGVCQCGEHCWFALTRGLVAFSDAARYAELAARGAWRAHAYGYAETGGSYTRVAMHHLVLGQRVRVDHRDGEPWNNRRENLRPATHGQNMQNRRCSSGLGLKGVAADPRRPRYRAEVQADGIRHRGKWRLTITEAAADYDALALRHHGEFAATNARLGLL